ncbi:hypothetical protein J6590_044564 [Homalodisca vitripennis]|nr:hypothetical protein J6590_044564 [Homalodisca vitripennis]
MQRPEGAGSWRHTRENTIGSAKHTSVPATIQEHPLVLRYALVENKEEVTPTWGRRKEQVRKISPEKIKYVKLRSEREKKCLVSRKTVRGVSQLGSGIPRVAGLPGGRGGLPCSQKPTTPEGNPSEP